jgi:hypothetical protein
LNDIIGFRNDRVWRLTPEDLLPARPIGLAIDLDTVRIPLGNWHSIFELVAVKINSILPCISGERFAVFANTII